MFSLALRRDWLESHPEAARVIQTAMRSSFCALLAALLLAPPSLPAHSQEPATTPKPAVPQSFSARVAGLRHMDGFLPLDWDAKTGKLYLEIPLALAQPGAEVLYTDSLPYGTGSNDLGLDRGQTSAGRIVRFDQQGPKVLLTEVNEQFRGSTTDPAEQLAIRQSFPESVLWGFKIEAEDPNGTLLLDATDFFLRDVHNVSEALAKTQQGTYKVDMSRSAIALDGTKAFPKNTEVEAILTFSTDGAPHGAYVRDVTPDPRALTVRERQSFIALPGPGFTSRRYDPRAGYFEAGYRDYSARLGDDLDQRLIVRHRLTKKDPTCRENCDPVDPIVYYVDRGAPEPIRSALVEGASWWNQAFTAAGWHNAFQVKVLPADADPMDVRYNIIQWVHRYTRGWSYGAAVTDPRTGEILKGNVTLGSLRGRQDYLIAEALLSPYKDGKPLDPAHDPMLAMVLARIRQLSAHETGHTLGLAHNFAASSYSQSASVMDYPHPYITLKDGVPDLSHAYASSIGVWDKVAINYGYRQFAPETTPAAELSALNGIITSAERQGIPYITDQDARPLGSAHPHAHLWDTGTDSAQELDRILTIRSAALGRFGINAIREGTPVAQIEETLVPLYLLHRYETEAAAKEIGGLQYEYNLRGDGQPDPAIVPAAEQRHALSSVLKTLSPALLTLPESLLKILPPQPPGFPRTQESFPAHTGLTFDPVASAESAADLTLALLFDPERASRLIQYNSRDPQAPDLHTVIHETLKAVCNRPSGAGLDVVVSRAVEGRAVEALLTLATNPAASSEARFTARSYAVNLRSELTKVPENGTEAETVFNQGIAARVAQFIDEPSKFVGSKSIEAPPGMPIGSDDNM